MGAIEVPAANNINPKVAIQCEFELLCFKQTLERIDILVFQTANFGKPRHVV